MPRTFPKELTVSSLCYHNLGKHAPQPYVCIRNLAGTEIEARAESGECVGSFQFQDFMKQTVVTGSESPRWRRWRGTRPHGTRSWRRVSLQGQRGIVALSSDTLMLRGIVAFSSKTVGPAPSLQEQRGIVALSSKKVAGWRLGKGEHQLELRALGQPMKHQLAVASSQHVKSATALAGET